MIIGVLNQKGGVGKTTIAVNIAAFLGKSNRRVLLVDADPQASALAWSSARTTDPIFPVVGMPKPSLHRDLPALSIDYDVVVIDGAPRVNELARAAILASDIVLVPIQPSPYDVWAAAETVKLIREARQYREKLEAVFVINRRIANTAIGRDVSTALKQFEDVPVLAASLTQRVIYAESAAKGLSVIEVAPKGDATKELERLVNQLTGSQQRQAA
jgi:chromosome partitioning protein